MRYQRAVCVITDPKSQMQDELINLVLKHKRLCTKGQASGHTARKLMHEIEQLTSRIQAISIDLDE